MATKLYFHDAANALSGTFPTGKQSTTTASNTATGANTLKTMNDTIGVAQASATNNTSASTSQQQNFMRMFCSPPLSGNQTICPDGTDTINIWAAYAESNTNVDLLGLAIYLYVWRPSTGAIVGSLKNTSGSATVIFIGQEPGAAASERSCGVNSFDLSANGGGSVAAQNGDVIICEIWHVHTQVMATAYTTTFYYDGTTENTTANSVVSNNASFIEFTQNLVFQGTNVVVSPNPAAAVGSGVAPTVVRSSISLAPAVAAAVGAVVAPTVITGNPSVTIAPTPAVGVGAVIAPSVILGSLSLAPVQASAAGAIVAPAVRLSSLTITPAIATAAGTIVNPTVITGNPSVIFTPASADAVGTVVAPTTIAGSLVLAPAQAIARGDQVAPGIVRSSLSVAPSPSQAVGGTVSPAVIQAAIALSPIAVVARGTVVDPLTTQGSISLTPGVAVAKSSVLSSVLTTGGEIASPSAAVAKSDASIEAITTSIGWKFGSDLPLSGNWTSQDRPPYSPYI